MARISSVAEEGKNLCTIMILRKRINQNVWFDQKRLFFDQNILIFVIKAQL